LDNASEVLIVPFQKILEELTLQAQAWLMIHKSLEQTARLPDYFEDVENHKNDFSEFKEQADLLAKITILMMQINRESIIYPWFIGSWAVLEASFDELVLKILVYDKNILEKLIFAEIKHESIYEINSLEWAKVIYKRIASKSSQDAQGSVFRLHKNCLKVFGISLEFQPDKVNTIEEINQIRNCILHNNAVIDDKAARICTRLNVYLGVKIPASDKIFTEGVDSFASYLLAWIAALMHSSYLNEALLPDSKNPFAL
jgi:hypothetical protein